MEYDRPSASPSLGHAAGIGEHSLLRSGGSKLGKSGSARAKVSLCQMIMLPWFLLVLILGCYLQAGASGYHFISWTIPPVLLMLTTFFTWQHYKAGNTSEVFLGLFCVIAVLIGLLVGAAAMSKYLTEYYRLGRGASYFGVIPSEPAAGKLDGTTFEFTSTTAVDVSRAYGFVDVHSVPAITYCVAPISDSQVSSGTRIQYWATGINCCQSRGDFHCGSADMLDVHAAIVHAESVQKSSGYDSAVKGALSAYGLTSGDHYLLLQWTKNPYEYRAKLWSNSITLSVVFVGVYLVISTMVGCALSAAMQK